MWDAQRGEAKGMEDHTGGGSTCVRPLCVPPGCDGTGGQAGPGAAQGGFGVAAGGL